MVNIKLVRRMVFFLLLFDLTLLISIWFWQLLFNPKEFLFDQIIWHFPIELYIMFLLLLARMDRIFILFALFLF